MQEQSVLIESARVCLNQYAAHEGREHGHQFAHAVDHKHDAAGKTTTESYDLQFYIVQDVPCHLEHSWQSPRPLARRTEKHICQSD